jgi:hypothetical protein
VVEREELIGRTYRMSEEEEAWTVLCIVAVDRDKRQK